MCHAPELGEALHDDGLRPPVELVALLPQVRLVRDFLLPQLARLRPTHGLQRDTWSRERKRVLTSGSWRLLLGMVEIRGSQRSMIRLSGSNLCLSYYVYESHIYTNIVYRHNDISQYIV